MRTNSKKKTLNSTIIGGVADQPFFGKSKNKKQAESTTDNFFQIQRKEDGRESTDSEVTKTNDDKSITLSRGVLQFITEGDFSGDTDVRKPHFPENVSLFQELTADEKSEVKGKKYDGSRYNGPDDIGRFTKNSNGDYKFVKITSRHDKATYTNKLESDQKLGVGGHSGVTIGFGLDIGNKWASTEQATVKKFFQDAGVSEDISTKLSKAAGLQGLEAGKKAAELRADVTLTEDQVFAALDSTIKDYDSKGYTKGDGSIHSAIEEVMMYLRYWGEPNGDLITATKGKKGVEQFEAAKKSIKDSIDNLSDNSWKKPGYTKILTYLEIMSEMAAAGYEISMKDKVLGKDDLVSDSDQTFKFVQDVTERSNDFGKGKDLKKAVSDTELPSLIKDKVGESAKNNIDDLKVIQQLLYNANYDIEITGEYDDKTKAAIKKFTKDEVGKERNIIEPDSKGMRVLKKYQYKVREKEVVNSIENQDVQQPSK